MMLIEVTVRYIESPQAESRSTTVYAVPPTDDWRAVLKLKEFMRTISRPLLAHGAVEVFEDGHEPWDAVLSERKEAGWCAQHERFEVVP